jgi:hypothetical protein
MGHTSASGLGRSFIGDNIDAVKKNTEALIDASKKVGLKANTQKIKSSTGNLGKTTSVTQILT